MLIHAYHDRSINRAIDAGIRVVDHGFLMSEETMKRMAAEGVALSLQAVMSVEAFANPEEITFFTADQKAKAAQVNKGAVQMMEWARKHDVLIVTGGDMFSSAYGPRQADNMIIMKNYGFTPVEILKVGTSNAAEVLSWSGGMNPYKDGPLGIITEGAYADVILVDGNPLENIDMIQRAHVRVVVKDGAIYKNTLGSGEGNLSDVAPVTLGLVAHAEERALWRELVERYHYLRAEGGLWRTPALLGLELEISS